MIEEELADIEDQSAGPAQSTFDAFVRGLPPRLTADQQRALLTLSKYDTDPGAHHAFNRLWLDTSRLVVRVYFSILKSIPADTDPMDVIQEGLLAARGAVEGWDPCKGALSTWVFPRVRGAMLTFIRKDMKGSDDLLLGAPGDTEALLEADDEQAERLTEALTYPQPDDKELYVRAMRERLQSLPTQQGTFLELRYLKGMNPNEIASHLGVSRSTVHRGLLAALRHLRTLHIARSKRY